MDSSYLGSNPILVGGIYNGDLNTELHIKTSGKTVMEMVQIESFY